MKFEKTPLAYCLAAALLSLVLGFLAMADLLMAKDDMAMLPTWLLLPLAMTGLTVSLVSALAIVIGGRSRHGA